MLKAITNGPAVKALKMLIVLLLLLCRTSSAWAAWSGPVEVLTGTWGAGQEQFGIRERYNGAVFPRTFIVDKDDTIIIADVVNKRAKIYNRKGNLRSIVNSRLIYNDVQLWPTANMAARNGTLIVNFEDLYQQYDYTGDLAQEFRIRQSKFVAFLPDTRMIVNLYEKKEGERFGRDLGYAIYSPDGELLTTSPRKPVDLGWSEQIGDEKAPVAEANNVIYFPDHRYAILHALALQFVRDGEDKDAIYVTSPQPISKFRCGKLLGTVEMPKSTYETIRPPSGDSPEVLEVVEEYGPPVVAPNGDVYTWKRTSLGYSILKWTWKDAPADVFSSWDNEPRNLAAVAAREGIDLTWDISLQDPGCATGYEIGRAKASGGPYTKIGSVGSGVMHYRDSEADKRVMYFYAVRTILRGDVSGYSNEAEAER